jgi:hypothetical protein
VETYPKIPPHGLAVPLFGWGLPISKKKAVPLFFPRKQQCHAPVIYWLDISFLKGHLTIILQICQIIGLAGIDLFTPSDVVDKRNVRKVCMCIRSLSKKASMMNLNVSPGFECNLFKQSFQLTYR